MAYDPTTSSAFSQVVALASSTLLLFGAGWEIGREADLGVSERLAMAIGAGAFGVMMAVLKALLH